MSVAPFTKTLDQELVALARGVTLECLVCGEFLLTATRQCWRARSAARSSPRAPRSRKWSYHPSCRPGDRGCFRGLEESPDTAGQDAGALGAQAAKADGKWNRKETAG